MKEISSMFFWDLLKMISFGLVFVSLFGYLSDYIIPITAFFAAVNLKAVYMERQRRREGDCGRLRDFLDYSRAALGFAMLYVVIVY